MEDGGVLGIPADAIIQRPGFRLRQPRRLGIDGRESVGVLGIGVYLDLNMSGFVGREI